ncbi:hemerythrin domain-containing protein [Methanoculleus sp. FWC-SCC1]|uniref:Hemerythrin domain-containing protein n=1 Tax=Methanoculleus frigidifontis TaxID=2584085 RepID=A0ABT8M8Q3_9EURY|nr:hemerythrin domain-containing protein [Methanoculleus sp. FWC-SCC1]MDN7024322.1 hemerythrin domain-containing protein [Methanoculleus sp. FWC-SCC1]
MARNVIDILKQEHEEVLSMLEKLSSKGVSDRSSMYSSMKSALLPHMEGEEKAVYPGFEQAGMHDKVLESIEEHNAVKSLISQLDNASMSNEDVWVAKIKVIRENVQHHVKEEEEEIFPKARQSMSSSDLEEMGNKFEEAKGKVPMAAR